MEQELRALDELQVTVLVDNVIDFTSAAKSDYAKAPRQWADPEKSRVQYLHAGHGLSLLIKATQNGESHQVLYDTGPSPEILEHNVRNLGIDFSEIDAIVMSHGHWDHFGGLLWALNEIGRSDTPVIIHPLMLNKRRVVLEDGRAVDFPEIPSEDEISRAGARIEKTAQSIVFAGNMLLRTGEIPRETTFELGFKGHQMKVKETWVDDTAVIDDNCLVAKVKNRGLVVVTGCAHSGVVNSIHEAQRLTGEERVLAVIGGIHLMGASPEKIKHTINGLMDLEGSEVFSCGHCTGWTAQKELAEICGDLYVHANVGTQFKFSS